MSTSTPSLRALVPVKITGRHYGENLTRLDILFSSLRRFAAPGTLDGIAIITPADEWALVRDFASGWSDLAVEVLAEDELFPAFRRFQKPWQVRPWQRQQIIKLNAPALLAADFVLTLDPDVVALQPFDRGLLLPDGKALLQPEARAVHRQWWRDSADLLALPPQLDRPGMGVTPAILSTAILARLQDRLELVGGKPWMDVLLTSYSNWTEYSLYYLAAESSGLLQTYHAVGPHHDASRPALQIAASASVWAASESNAATIQAMFAGQGHGVFGVVQSNAEVPAADIIAAAESVFPVQRTPAPPLPSAGAPTRRLRERSRTAMRLTASGLYRARRKIARATSPTTSDANHGGVGDSGPGRPR